jgi:hypothetical protein
MAGSSAQLHENPDVLGSETIDRHRAIVSLMEELEAVDWYDQRAKAATDADLKAILAHNRDEEKEHAIMTLEWLRLGLNRAPSYINIGVELGQRGTKENNLIQEQFVRILIGFTLNDNSWFRKRKYD